MCREETATRPTTTIAVRAAGQHSPPKRQYNNNIYLAFCCCFRCCYIVNISSNYIIKSFDSIWRLFYFSSFSPFLFSFLPFASYLAAWALFTTFASECSFCQNGVNQCGREISIGNSIRCRIVWNTEIKGFVAFWMLLYNFVLCRAYIVDF